MEWGNYISFVDYEDMRNLTLLRISIGQKICLKVKELKRYKCTRKCLNVASLHKKIEFANFWIKLCGLVRVSDFESRALCLPIFWMANKNKLGLTTHFPSHNQRILRTALKLNWHQHCAIFNTGTVPALNRFCV